MRLFLVSSTLGERLKAARKRKKLSQGKLGELVGGSQQQIQLMEIGETLNSKYFHPICEVLDITYDWLVYGDDNKKTPKTDNVEGMVSTAVDCLNKAIGNMTAINLSKGQEPEKLDKSVLLEAFKIHLVGELTGDYVTAALTKGNIKSVSNGD